jgi:hypothetical protein
VVFVFAGVCGCTAGAVFCTVCAVAMGEPVNASAPASRVARKVMFRLRGKLVPESSTAEAPAGCAIYAQLCL